MPACTDRVSQAPDDPIDSARGPSYLASCRQRLISGLSGGHLRMPPPPSDLQFLETHWQQVIWNLQSPEGLEPVQPTDPSSLHQTN